RSHDASIIVPSPHPRHSSYSSMRFATFKQLVGDRLEVPAIPGHQTATLCRREGELLSICELLIAHFVTANGVEPTIASHAGDGRRQILIEVEGDQEEAGFTEGRLADASLMNASNSSSL